MFYNVLITQKSNRSHDEVKLDLTKERLISQFIESYEKGNAIVVNGKTIPLNDIERIKITQTQEESKNIFPLIKMERIMSGVITTIPDEWYVANKGKDVTDDFITGPPGHSKKIDETIQKKLNTSSKKIFIVHGHDIALKNDVELFIKSIGLDPVVLHRQPDKGLTIIEKLEENTDLGYALVLLTPDDIGYSIKESSKKENERIVEFRARQNVIFEFGYLVGRLGRDKVCCVFKEGVVPPSDLSGLLYKKIINSIDDVGMQIIKELKTAGYKIDFN